MVKLTFLYKFCFLLKKLIDIVVIVLILAKMNILSNAFLLICTVLYTDMNNIGTIYTIIIFVVLL